MRCLIGNKTLLDLFIDRNTYRLINKEDADIIWKILALDTGSIFCITDLCFDKIQSYTTSALPPEALTHLVEVLQRHTDIIPVTKDIVEKACSSYARSADIEAKIELACVSAYSLEAIVSHRPALFDFSNTTSILTPKQLLEYLPRLIQVTLALEMENDFSGQDFREENFSGLDLSNKNFSRATLSEVDLTNTNFVGTNLSDADLRGAHLIMANLSEANLTNANLSRADLARATLTEAILANADVTDANLSEAILTHTKVTGMDFTSFDLSDVDLSSIDLADAKLRDFTVRNISTLSELKQVSQLESALLGASALDYHRLAEWWQSYPFGIKGLFYQGKIVVGVVSIWPLAEEMIRRFEAGIEQGTFQEYELETASLQFLQTQQGTQYWYVGAIYLNKSLLISKGNLGFNFMAKLMFDSYKIWVQDEQDYIDKAAASIEILAVSINENQPDIHDNVYRLLRKLGFEKQAGETFDHSPLYKLSRPFADMMPRLERAFAWAAARTQQRIDLERLTNAPDGDTLRR